MIKVLHSYENRVKNLIKIALLRRQRSGGLQFEVSLGKKFTRLYIAALFTIAKLWKQPRCPTTDEWIKKMWYLYTIEFYSATKKNDILSL
jgi:hypothetical protein